MNMRAIIVEDEPRVRKGLSESLDWGLFGLELIGTAANGLEGLELFKEHEPELVIADIRMPVMDGLAMSEAILDIKPDTEIMIISGHDEFEYAQRCVSLGVTNYLLKPIGKKMFQAELGKISQSWRAKRQKQEQLQHFEKKLNSSLPMMRNAFLEEWLGGFTYRSEDMLKESFSFLNISFDFRSLAAVALFELDLEEISHYSHRDCRLLEYAMNNIICELIPPTAVAYQRGNGQTAVIFATEAADPALNLLPWVEKTRAQASAILKISITVGISTKAVQAPDLPQVFQEAHRVLRLKLSLGSNMILSEGMIRPEQKQLACMQEFDEAILIHGVEMNDEVEITRVIQELFAKWQAQNELVYPDEIFYLFTGMFTNLAHRLGKSIHSYLNPGQLQKWRHPEEFRSIEEVQSWWLLRFIELSRSYEGYRSDRRTNVVQQVMDYVADHIYDNITRDDVAKYVYINSSYLSRIFKEVTGESFSDYVIRSKMEKAVHLLQVERVMVYEVADRLGYRDPSYFARIFKKYTGKSPSEYQA